MKIYFYILLFFSFNLLSSVKIVTTLPVWSKVAKEIGKEHIEVRSLLTSEMDPHTISERPTFKLALNGAKGLIETGRDLEPWVNNLVKFYPKIERLKASENISPLNVPDVLTRKKGDIHAQGNPHVWLSISAVYRISEDIKNFISKIDPANSLNYTNNLNIFRQKLTKLYFGEKILEHFTNNLDFAWRLYEGNKLKEYLTLKKLPIDGLYKESLSLNTKVIAYHDAWDYFKKDFPHIQIAGFFEETPGSSPTIKHINTLKNLKDIKIIIVESYNKSKTREIQKLSEHIKAKVLFVSIDCMENETYFDFILRIVNSFKA